MLLKLRPSFVAVISMLQTMVTSMRKMRTGYHSERVHAVQSAVQAFSDAGTGQFPLDSWRWGKEGAINLMLRIVCITHGSSTMTVAGVAVTTQRLSAVLKKLPHKSNIYRCFHINQPPALNYPAARIIKLIHYLINDNRLLNIYTQPNVYQLLYTYKARPLVQMLSILLLTMYLYIASHGELISVSSCSYQVRSLQCHWIYLQYQLTTTTQLYNCLSTQLIVVG